MTGTLKDSTILVTGASGLLGANYLALMEGRSRLVACCHSHGLAWPGVEVCSVDLSSDDEVKRLFDRVRPDLVFHFAATTDLDRCESDPLWAEKHNIQATRHIAACAERSGSRMVYMSTDSVFDGNRGHYDEEAIPNPLNVYARSKLKGEEAVRVSCRAPLIVRACIYGWSPTPKKSLGEWILSKLTSGDELGGFTDLVFTPLLATSLSEEMMGLVDRNATGTYHLGSSDAVTKYEFAVRLARTFGYPEALVRPIESASLGFKAARPRNVSLNCAKAEAFLGKSMRSIDEDLTAFKLQGEQNHKGKLASHLS